jgi:hypothetical protein
MAKICLEGLPGKIGRCINTGPQWPPPLKLPPQHGAAIGEPGLYAEIFVDASILNSIHTATKTITDKGTRDALATGIESALEALRKRAGKEVASITLDD